jgi:hypothetical protein
VASPWPARPWPRPRRPRQAASPGTAADRGLPARRTGPVQLPACRLGPGHQAGVHPVRLRGPGIRRPAWPLGAARGPRRVPVAGTSRRQTGADDHQHRLGARNQPGTARPGPHCGVTRVAFEDPATAARRKTKQSARPWRWASTSPTCRSTSKASWSANWRPAEPIEDDDDSEFRYDKEPVGAPGGSLRCPVFGSVGGARSCWLRVVVSQSTKRSWGQP